MLRKFTSIHMVCILLFCCVSISSANSFESLAPLCVAEVIQTDHFVSRLSEFENTPNTIGFLRQDGAKTVYVFNQDIRYIENGVYVDKTTLNQNNTRTSSIGSSVQHIGMADSFVSSAQPTTCFGNHSVAYIGTHDTYGVSHMYVKFTGLASLGIDYNRVISAYYHVTDNTITTRSEIEAYYATEDWNETTINWNNRPDYDGNEIITTLNIPNTHGSDISDFYITQAVKGWLQGLPSYGILLKDKDNDNLVTFATKEDSTAANYLCITYYDEDDTSYVSTNTDSSRLGTQGITSGDYYYIYNKNSGLFLTAESDSENAGIYQNNLNGTHLQKWKLTYNSNGDYYTLACGSTGYHLQVNGTTAYNLRQLKTTSPTTGTNQRWKVIRNWDGSYQIASMIDTNYVISVALGSANDGAFCCLYQHTVDHSREDDWTILPVEKGPVSIYNFDLTYVNSMPYSSYIETFLHNMGFSNIRSYTNTQTFEDASALTGYQNLQTDSIMLYYGHGHEGALTFCTDDYPTPPNNLSKIKGSNIINESNSYALNTLPYNQLSKLQLLLTNSCCTGQDLNYGEVSELSFVGTAYDRGAHFVTSHLLETSGVDSSSHEWRLRIIMGLVVGKDIYTALADADEYLYGVMNQSYNNQNSRHTMGDGSIKVIESTASTATASLQTTNLAHAANRMTSQNFLSTVTPVMSTANGHYKDSASNLYQIETNGKISSYVANTDSFELGDYEVNQTVALKTAENFLNKMGVSTDGCTLTHSNAYSKTFRVVYENDAKRISVTLKADENGNVYITHYFNTDKEGLL